MSEEKRLTEEFHDRCYIILHCPPYEPSEGYLETRTISSEYLRDALKVSQHKETAYNIDTYHIPLRNTDKYELELIEIHGEYSFTADIPFSKMEEYENILKELL